MRIELVEGANGSFYAVQMARMDMKGKILSIEDSSTFKLDDSGPKIIEKVSLSATEYDGTNKAKVHVKHYMDGDDFMVLCQDIYFGKAVKFQDYKGSPDPKSPTGYEARELKVSLYTEAEGCKMPGGAYTFDFRVGPGVKGDLGQVSMSDQHKDKAKTLKILIPMAEARRAFVAANIYCQAKLSAFLTVNYSKIYGKI